MKIAHLIFSLHFISFFFFSFSILIFYKSLFIFYLIHFFRSLMVIKSFQPDFFLKKLSYKLNLAILLDFVHRSFFAAIEITCFNLIKCRFRPEIIAYLTSFLWYLYPKLNFLAQFFKMSVCSVFCNIFIC